jgi:hypothetical protein
MYMAEIEMDNSLLPTTLDGKARRLPVRRKVNALYVDFEWCFDAMYTAWPSPYRMITKRRNITPEIYTTYAVNNR